MDPLNINGVSLTELKTIKVSQGDVFHVMKKSDRGFAGFGEAYFSTINQGQIKGWKKHMRMTLNFVVPIGEVKFVIFDDRENSGTKGAFAEIVLSPGNYKRLTVPPGLWVGFAGIADSTNLVLNIADIEHDPSEAQSLPLKEINYDWNCFQG